MNFSLIFFLQQYQRAVVFRFGKINGGAKGPGILIINPFLDQVEIVDLRTLSFNVPPQEILSKDSVTVKVDAVVYYSIHVSKSIFYSKREQNSIFLLLQGPHSVGHQREGRQHFYQPPSLHHPQKRAWD